MLLGVLLSRRVGTTSHANILFLLLPESSPSENMLHAAAELFRPLTALSRPHVRAAAKRLGALVHGRVKAPLPTRRRLPLARLCRRRRDRRGESSLGRLSVQLSPARRRGGRVVHGVGLSAPYYSVRFPSFYHRQVR